MKITSCGITIEVSRDENGYFNNYYVDITEQGVAISHPYIKQSPEQVTLVNELVNQFIDDFNHLNRRVDGFNRDNHLEQYAPKALETEESASEVSTESALGQPERGVSDQAAVIEQIVKDNEGDGEAVAHFTEELSKIIDARKKKD